MNTPHLTSRKIAFGLIVGIISFTISCSSSGRLSKDPIARGEASFQSYCTSCHGENATGNGPVAEVLTVKPADLTQLRKNNDGVYPADRVYATIDGREVMYSHGTRQMPIWGNIWRENNGKPRSEEEVDRQISEIVEYLRTIQQPADE